MEVPLPVITNALDAILWTVNPWLDAQDIHDAPWIVELVGAYNDLVELLPYDDSFCYQPIEI